MADQDEPTAAPPRGRLRYWTLTLGKFGAVQMAVQALGAVSGILIVRHLSKADYALFTIANSMQGTMNLLADSGVSVALMAVGGKVWQDRRRLGELVHTALRMRRRLAVFVVAAVVPLLVWLLAHNGAGTVYTAVLTAAVVAGLSFQLGLDVYIVVPRLHSQIARLQTLDFVAAALRLGLLAAFFWWFLNASVAVWITTAGIAWQLLRARRWAREQIAPDAGVNAADRREVGRKIRQMLPSALFYCLQGQIVVFLLSVAGRSGQVAEVGALGRLTVLFNAVSPLMAGVVLPAFSRCQVSAVLRKRYWQVLGGFLAVGASFVLCAVFCAGPLLWILGGQYDHLRHELVLIVCNTVLGMVVSAMWSMNAARGWVDKIWLEIPARLLLQAGLVFVVDLTSLSGALWFSILSQVSPLLVNAWLTRRGFRALHPATPVA